LVAAAQLRCALSPFLPSPPLPLFRHSGAQDKGPLGGRRRLFFSNFSALLKSEIAHLSTPDRDLLVPIRSSPPFFSFFKRRQLKEEGLFSEKLAPLPFLRSPRRWRRWSQSMS